MIHDSSALRIVNRLAAERYILTSSARHDKAEGASGDEEGHGGLQGQPIKARKMQGYIKSSANEESAEDKKRPTSVDSESKSRSREAEDGRVEAGWDEKISKSCNREGERVDVESTVTESIQSVLP
jgi:hypothetical protein